MLRIVWAEGDSPILIFIFSAYHKNNIYINGNKERILQVSVFVHINVICVCSRAADSKQGKLLFSGRPQCGRTLILSGVKNTRCISRWGFIRSLFTLWMRTQLGNARNQSTFKTIPYLLLTAGPWPCICSPLCLLNLPWVDIFVWKTHAKLFNVLGKNSKLWINKHYQADGRPDWVIKGCFFLLFTWWPALIISLKNFDLILSSFCLTVSLSLLYPFLQARWCYWKDYADQRSHWSSS